MGHSVFAPIAAYSVFVLLIATITFATKEAREKLAHRASNQNGRQGIMPQGPFFIALVISLQLVAIILGSIMLLLSPSQYEMPGLSPSAYMPMLSFVLHLILIGILICLWAGMVAEVYTDVLRKRRKKRTAVNQSFQKGEYLN